MIDLADPKTHIVEEAGAEAPTMQLVDKLFLVSHSHPGYKHFTSDVNK